MPRFPLRFAPFGLVLFTACGSSTPPASPAAPSAAPAPTAPAPVPVPTPASGASLPASCRVLPPATGNTSTCHVEGSDFLRAVSDAVSAAQGAVVVDPDSKETYAVVQNGLIQSPNTYLKLIIDALDHQGLCAAYDGEELNVRTSSGYNELFDVITGTGGSWSKYMSTCAPATPIPSQALPVLDPECKLAPSKDSYCDRAASQYGGDVVAALDELIADERKLSPSAIFDFTSRAPGVDTGWRVANVPLYFSEMRKRVRARGYCNIYSGDDELLIKKGTNRLSEHWDLLSGEGYSLRLLAATCHDAAF